LSEEFQRIAGSELNGNRHRFPPLERAQERGTTEEEIKEAIETGFPIPAKYARMGKAKIFPFSQARRGTYYEQKRVEVFYISQRDIIVTVTVYVFYGRREI
jgi:hypothetical protein